MKIEHLAIWTDDLERLRQFYEKYFGAIAGERYHNPTKKFHSYFLSFSSGPRLEIMSVPDLDGKDRDAMKPLLGLAHFAVSVGSKAQVDLLTEQFRSDGFVIAGEPRTTGDGYYESVILDPDGNRIELTV